MTCGTINVLFVPGALLIAASVAARRLAWQYRLPTTPGSLFYTNPMSFFKKELYSERGNRIRRVALAIAAVGASLFLASLALYFVYRSRGLGGGCLFAP